MEQHVLRIAIAIFEPSQQLDNLRMNAMNADVEDGLLARFANRFFEFLLRLANHLLDSSRVDATV
jgi:hypothetical protein